MTECTLRGNELGVEGWTTIFNTLCDSPASRISTWDLFGEDLGPEIAEPLASYISVTALLTWVDVRKNMLGREGRGVFRKAVEGRSGFELLLQMHRCCAETIETSVWCPVRGMLRTPINRVLGRMSIAYMRDL